MPPFASGSTTLKKAPMFEHPSTIAASSSSCGISSKKVFISHVAKGSVTTPYIITSPYQVSVILKNAHIIMIGIMIAIGGNILSCSRKKGS